MHRKLILQPWELITLLHKSPKRKEQRVHLLSYYGHARQGKRDCIIVMACVGLLYRRTSFSITAPRLWHAGCKTSCSHLPLLPASLAWPLLLTFFIRCRVKFLQELLDHMLLLCSVQISSVAQLCLTLLPPGLQHARLPCPSATPWACSNSCPLSQC